MRNKKRRPKKERTTERKMDAHYEKALNRIVDKLFELAKAKQWTWEQMAEESGLSRTTIYALGARETRWPQYRTVELLAKALGGRMDYVKGTEGKLPKRTWTLKIFGGKRKVDNPHHEQRKRVRAA